MIALMIITLLLVIIAGVVTLKHAVKNAATGYEDEFGFHEGADPQRAGILQAALEGPAGLTSRKAVRARQVPKRVASKSQHQGSATPFHVG
jgi:hypothetical protein